MLLQRHLWKRILLKQTCILFLHENKKTKNKRSVLYIVLLHICAYLQTCITVSCQTSSSQWWFKVIYKLHRVPWFTFMPFWYSYTLQLTLRTAVFHPSHILALMFIVRTSAQGDAKIILTNKKFTKFSTQFFRSVYYRFCPTFYSLLSDIHYTVKVRGKYETLMLSLHTYTLYTHGASWGNK